MSGAQTQLQPRYLPEQPPPDAQAPHPPRQQKGIERERCEKVPPPGHRNGTMSLYTWHSPGRNRIVQKRRQYERAMEIGESEKDRFGFPGPAELDSVPDIRFKLRAAVLRDQPCGEELPHGGEKSGAAHSFSQKKSRDRDQKPHVGREVHQKGFKACRSQRQALCRREHDQWRPDHQHDQDDAPGDEGPSLLSQTHPLEQPVEGPAFKQGEFKKAGRAGYCLFIHRRLAAPSRPRQTGPPRAWKSPVTPWLSWYPGDARAKRRGDPPVVHVVDMLSTCRYAWVMSKMIQLRHVPDDLHRKLKARAALAGMPLSDYLLQEVRRVAERPTIAELRSRLAHRPSITPTASPTKAMRSEREGR